MIAKLEQHHLGENFSVNIDKATKGVGFSVKIACPHECNQITLIHTPVSLDELSKRKEYNFGTIPYDMDFGYQVKARNKDTVNGKCDINITRGSDVQIDLEKVDSLYKKHMRLVV